jgi:predicted deacylase
MNIPGFEEVADQVWRRKGEGRKLAVVGSIHGDETAGAEVIREILHADDRLWRRAGPIDLTLAIGNPRALEQGARFSEGGRDLNRIFEGSEVDTSDYEGARAEVLKETLGHADLLLDLHQTSCATPPVAVIEDTPAHLRLSAALGIAHAVVGIEAVYGGTMLSRWFDSLGGLGLTVETGQKGKEEARAAAYEIVRRFLTAGASASAQGGRIRRYRLRRAWRSPANGLRFSRALGNTARIRAGEIVGHTDDGPLSCDEDSVVFLPREGAGQGTPCMLLATDEGVLTV